LFGCVLETLETGENMPYRRRLLIPKNTSKESPEFIDVKMTKCIINQVEVSFPVGCYGLAGIQIWRGLHQLWPANTGEWFAYDDITIVFGVDYFLDEQPYILRVFGYNEDDTFPHNPVVRFVISKIIAVRKLTEPVSLIPQIWEMI